MLERRRSERVDSVLDDPEIDHQATRRLGVHAALYVPLVARGRAIGVVIAHDRRGQTPVFTDDDLRLAESLAQRASVAVDLSERVSRDAMRRVVAAQELERARLARELHDETGQALTSILLGLKAVEQASRPTRPATRSPGCGATVASTLQDVRALAVELRPSALDDFGLVPALERLASTFREQTGMAVDFEAGSDVERLPPETETALYRIVQEALTNVAKHAGATRVSHSRRPARGCGRRGDRGRRRGLRPRSGPRRRPRPRRDARARRARGRAPPHRVVARGRDDDRRRGAAVTIRVLVVDDHAVVRAGLRRILDAEDDVETVGEAPDGERAVFEAMQLQPDVVLMDVVMPGKSGIDATRAVLQAVPATKVLVLSMQDDPRYVREAFDAGASGYVMKEAADDEVVDAIRAVAAGQRYLHPALGARLLAAESEERRRAAEDPLSEREREVLRLLALGHTNQEIAKLLYISVRTAETHRAHIMRKLDLSSRAELVRYALAEGLLE